MLKKLLISIFVAISLLATPLSYVKAAEWYDPSYGEFVELVYDDTTPAQEIFGERYTAAQVKWIFFSLVHMVISPFVNDKVFICMNSHDGGKCGQAVNEMTAYSESIRLAKEASGGVPTGKEILSKYFINNPNSGVGYVASKIRKLSPVDTAYAQGFGYSENEGSIVEKMWSSFRNISYGFFVIIAIVFAFMIMFRFKTSPQTVVTIQSALPKLAVTLILVTFSYAIAGFLIDITYVIIGLISTAFTQSGLFGSDTEWNAVFDYLITGPFNMGIVGILLQYCIAFMIAYFVAALSSAIHSIGSFSIAGFFSSILMLILGAIVPLVMLIVFLIVLFKLGWLLIKNFAQIILYIVFSPIIITFGAISPFGGGFTGWLKSLGARLAIYPALSIMIVLAWLFLGGGVAEIAGIEIDGLIDGVNTILNWLGAQAGDPGGFMPFDIDASTYGSAPWVPPLTIGGATLIQLIYVFISFAIFMLMPSVANMITAALNKKPFGYGSAIGEALMPAAAVGGAYTLNQMAGGKLPGMIPPQLQAAIAGSRLAKNIAKVPGMKFVGRGISGGYGRVQQQLGRVTPGPDFYKGVSKTLKGPLEERRVIPKGMTFGQITTDGQEKTSGTRSDAPSGRRVVFTSRGNRSRSDAPTERTRTEDQG